MNPNPRAEPAPAHAPADAAPILVVDDEEIVLAALKETLRFERYEVVACSDPADAVERLKRQAFSVVLTDQRMPCISGLELLGRARELQPHATRILVTAVLSVDTAIEAINQGEIYRFVIKPWVREELLATIKSGVQRYQLVCQNASLQARTQAMNQELLTLTHSLRDQVQRAAEEQQRLSGLNSLLEADLRSALALCARPLEALCPDLAGLARRVSQLSQAIADVLAMPAEQRRLFELAAWLADIGLVGIPPETIRVWRETPAQLSPADRALIQKHPLVSQQWSVSSGHPEEVGGIVRGHHERFDGHGYPDGLSGDGIPWLSRLLAVATAYILSPLPSAGILEEIKLASGTAYDPEAVRVLMQALPRAVFNQPGRQVSLAELRPGMTLARGVYSRSGALLVPEGESLDHEAIERLRSHYRAGAPGELLRVYC